MAQTRPANVTVTVRTRRGQVLERDLEAEEAGEVHEALMTLVAALFNLEQPEQARTITFEIERR